jgi:hypothetical protein
VPPLRGHDVPERLIAERVVEAHVKRQIELDESNDASWALNNQKAPIDYGYRATHLVTVVAKQILRQYYGRNLSVLWQSSRDGLSWTRQR